MSPAQNGTTAQPCWPPQWNIRSYARAFRTGARGAPQELIAGKARLAAIEPQLRTVIAHDES
jgi:hypothetical protein